MTRSQLLFFFIAGLFIAVTGSGIKSTLTFFKAEGVISINDHTISLDEFNRAKQKNPNLTESQLLTLMVDNVLLLQRAEELGLVHSDRVIRKVIVQHMIELEVQKALSEKLEEENLISFYQDNLSLFTSPDQFQVQIASFDDDAQCSRSQAVQNQYQEIKVISENWHTHRLHQPLANSLHSEVLVYRQLGNRLAKQVTQLAIGEMSEPIIIDQKCLLLMLIDRSTGIASNFDDIRDHVISEYRVRSRKIALANLLVQLRSKSDIKIAKDIVQVLSDA